MSQTDTRTSPERSKWNTRYAEKEFVWTATANRFLIEEAGDLVPGRALDLAAGEARNAIWLAEKGWTAHAVDFSEIGLEKGRLLAEARGVADKVTFETADLRDYTPELRGFDLVALFYLHLTADALPPIFKRAADAVAPGGTFLLVAHDLANLNGGHGGPQDPSVLYTAEDVVAALDGTLAIEKAGTVERPVETDAGTKIAIDCLVRAKRAG